MYAADLALRLDEPARGGGGGLARGVRAVGRRRAEAEQDWQRQSQRDQRTAEGWVGEWFQGEPPGHSTRLENAVQEVDEGLLGCPPG